MKKLFLLGSLFISPLFFAQELDAKLNTKTIKIGEPILLEYKVPFKKGDQIKIPQLKDTLNYHIEILDQKIDTVKDQIIHQLDITAFDEGDYLVPSIKIEKNGETFKTPTFQIEVKNVEIDTTQANVTPIKPVMEEAYNLNDYWRKYWIYGIIALAIFIIAVTLLVLYIRSKSKNLNNNEPKTPYEEVILALKTIDSKKYLKKGEQQEFYTQLSFITRRYIGKVYNFSALELLSDDVVNYITKKEEIKDEDKNLFKKFMFDADLAKFAKQEFNEDKNIMYRKWLGEFVERIKPIDIPENDSASKEDKTTGELYKKWDNS
jgi:hypothetical protein